MPLTPEPTVTEGATAGAKPPKRRPFLGALFVLLSLAVGLFLVVFPWSEWWSLNFLQDLIPALRNVWDEPSFRGAITGLGLVNVYVACVRMLQLLRRRS
jgi:hypothetical protein